MSNIVQSYGTSTKTAVWSAFIKYANATHDPHRDRVVHVVADTLESAVKAIRVRYPDYWIQSINAVDQFECIVHGSAL